MSEWRPPAQRQPSCPNCGSLSIQAVGTESTSLSRAAATELALGTAAGATAGRKTSIQVICLQCGATWMPGEQANWRLAGLTELEARVAKERGISQEQLKQNKAAQEQYVRDHPVQETAAKVFVWGAFLLVLAGACALLGSIGN